MSSDYNEELKDSINRQQVLMYRVVEEKLRRFKRLNRIMNALLLSGFILLAFSSLFLFNVLDRESGGRLVEKESVKTPLVAAIKNGGDLDILKHIYSRRQDVRPAFIMKKDRNKYYLYETAFSIILNDLLSDYLSEVSFTEDTLFHQRIISIINENNYRNPFDNLEESQRYYFENIRIKSDADYAIIREDINNIANELHEKNLLVEHYLSKSTTSFVVSIVALVLTFLFSIWQIILAYSNRKTDVLSERQEEWIDQGADLAKREKEVA